MYVNENVNPRRHKVGDCVVRAIAKAERKGWLETHDNLTTIARSLYTVLNDKMAYSKYLSKYPKIEVMHMVNGKRKRYTVKEIAKEMKGTYVIRLANHLTTVVDGKYYDIWDCGNSCAYIIWKVK